MKARDSEPLTQPGHQAMTTISMEAWQDAKSVPKWTTLESLIPVFAPSPKGGRRLSVDDRAV
jgi:hypothetical protein